MPHAVVEAEDRAGEQAGVGLRDHALLHPAREERGPGELEIAYVRARELARLLLAGRRSMDADERLLGDQHAVALDLVVREVEGRLEYRLQRLREVLVLGHDALELVPVRLHGERLDLIQAMELGLEVVIERRGADAHGLGDVGPPGVLVPVLTEEVDRGGNDVLSLAARGASGSSGATAR
jgi:hypothetical protein